MVTKKDLEKQYGHGFFGTAKGLQGCIDALKLYWPQIETGDHIHAMTAIHMVTNGIIDAYPEGEDK